MRFPRSAIAVEEKEVAMTTWKYILLGLSAPFAIAAMAHDASLGRATGAVACDVRATVLAGGVKLEAVATSTSDISGTYSLNVDTDGSGNSVVQGGDFEVRPGLETTLSTVVLGQEAGEGFTARLTLRWPTGSTSCSKGQS